MAQLTTKAVGALVLEPVAMNVLKGPAGFLTASYTPACGAVDHVLYWAESPIAGAVSWTRAECGLGVSGTAVFSPGDPSAGNFLHFVIVGQNSAREGSYGRSSVGIERPEATGIGACDRPQVTATSCP